MIKYLGSKKKLLPHIIKTIKDEKVDTVLDLFSGTSRVGHALMNEGISVISNDMTTYGYFLACTYVQSNPDHFPLLEKHIDELNDITILEDPGWFTQTYCINSRFFQPQNGLKVESIQRYIKERYGDSDIAKILVVSLMEAADRVDSTCGIQMAYLKEWASRSFKTLKLRVPDLSKGCGKAIQGDAMEIADMEVDLIYLDPPYNQHSYLGNYHIWETLCKGDRPSVYGVAQKREDVKTRKSPWNSKRKCSQEFISLIEKIKAPKIVLSFSNEGYLSKSFIETTLEKHFPRVDRIDIPYKRYVGAQIGIFNKLGIKVGKPQKAKNVEFLFVASR